MDTISNSGTGGNQGVVKEEGVASNGGSFFLVTEDEAKKCAEDYINSLKQRYLDFEALFNSGYFLATAAIISVAELANSIISLPNSAHFLITS